MRKICLFALILTLFTFAACQSSDEDDAPADDTEYLYIVKDGVSDFWVVRNDFASGVRVDAAVGIRRAIADATGVELGITTDWEKNPVYEHEILVGDTLREQTGYKVDRIALGESGYIIKEDGGKVYVSGGTDVGTKLAYEYFIANFVTGQTEVKIPVGYEYIVYHQYDIPELYINMNLVDESYKILIPEGADKNVSDAADRLKQAIYQKTGLVLDIATGSASGKAFIISADPPEVQGVNEIYTDQSSLIFRSSAKKGVAACVDLFINSYLIDKYGGYNFPSDFRYFDLGDYIIVKYPDAK